MVEIIIKIIFNAAIIIVILIPVIVLIWKKHFPVSWNIFLLDWSRSFNNAVENLGQLGDEKAIKPLLRKLFSSFDNSSQVIQALRQLDVSEQRITDECFHILKSGIENGHTGSRFRKAIQYLGQSGNIQAVGPLFEVLSSILIETYDKPSRLEAEKALQQLGATRDQMVDGYISVLKKGRLGAAQKLAKLGDKRAIEPLIEALCGSTNSHNYEDIHEALMKLGATKEQIFNAYIRALEGKGKFPIRNAAKHLALLGDLRAIDHLIDALSKLKAEAQAGLESNRKRWWKNWPDGDRGQEKAQEERRCFFFQYGGEEISSIIRALGELGGQRSLLAILDFLRPGSYCIPVAAAATVQISDVRALQPLQDLLAKLPEQIELWDAPLDADGHVMHNLGEFIWRPNPDYVAVKEAIAKVKFKQTQSESGVG